MKSWGAIIITAMGFLLGVVLAGIGGISAKTSLSSDNKKIEKYWDDSGLSEKELFELISNLNCRSSEKYFLACINSITQSLVDKHKYLSPESGEIEDLVAENSDEGITEKQRLSVYIQTYSKQLNAKINFEKIWTEMLELEKPEFKSSLIANGINAFLSIYKDPHTYILPENYYDEVGSKLERLDTFVGLSFEKKQTKTIIRKVYKNSDADLAGLQDFDEVISINQQAVLRLNLSEISQVLKEINTKQFAFQILRDNEKKEVIVTRSYKKLSHVQFEVISGIKNFALVTLTKFNRGVCEQISNHIKSAIDKNISGLILDLRDNPGGQLDEAACLAGLFLGMNKKTYSVEFFDPLKSPETVLSTGSLLYTGPLVVLTNSSSASASELLAGALKDYKRALIIGEKTFGKGTFQESEVWTKNPKISLFKTQGLYLLPSHRSPQLTGVQPDIEMDENHSKFREENSYFNPIQNLNHQLETSSFSSFNYQDSLQKCTRFAATKSTKDLFIQKSLQILSCHQLTTLFAQQYSSVDFN